jgi:Tol biopolymer transport system component/DNA-binding winged helix-turn-helix (wHTH) protein
VIEHKPFVFTFADVEVREREFCIVKAGEVLPVEPKAFRVLVFLLRSPHRLIPKDELLDAVWNDCAVSENSLTRSIALLRRLLGDDTREPRYIATVPTVGYRFLCDVQVDEDRFDGLGTVDLRQTNSGNGIQPSGRTPGVQSSSHDGGQTAVAERAEEKEEQPYEEGRRRSNRLLIPGVIAATLVVLVAGFMFYRAVSNRDARARHTIQPANAATGSSPMRTVRLTNLPGEVWGPAFSPDGEKIAFIWNGENPIRGDLYVQLVGSERPLRLTHTDHGFVCCANWSPDGRVIVFGRCDDNGGGVFVVPTLGGPERKLTDVVCPFGDSGYPKWIADGKSLLLADRCTPDGPRGLVVFSLETGEKRCLTAPPLYSEQGDSEPVLSPDGKTVAFQRTTSVDVAEIYTVPVSGGSPRQLTNEGTGAGSPMWSSDGQYIVFSSVRSGLRGIWRTAAAGGGVIERETVYPELGTLSHDGRRLAYVASGDNSGGTTRIWRIVLSRAGGQVVSRNKILEIDGGNAAVQPSPDGRQVAFQSGRSGKCGEIWRSATDGSDPLQLTVFEKGFSGTPRWSPDGKWVAFDHHTVIHGQIYVVDSEGRNLHVITSGDYENVVPSWSRDETAVYFASNRTGTSQVWRRELATGREAQITHHGGFAAFESYDAKTLYFSRFEGGGIWSMPVGGGEEKQVTAALHRGYWGHFAVTDAGIYLLDSDAVPKPTIMFYNFQTKRLTPVMQLEDIPLPWAANLAASRDGRTLLFAQATSHSSLTMAENFQ